MPRGGALLLASLLLAGTLPATLGFGSPVKEKRGWTLNSAGYLLGPRNGNIKNMSAAAAAAAKDAIDNHRSFHDKHGLAGKRELQPEDEARPGFERPLPEKDVVRTIIEFLTFLHRKEAGALDPTLPSAISSEDTEQP